MKTDENPSLSFRFLAGDHVETGYLPGEVVSDLVTLPLDHGAYFDLTVPHQIIPLDELVASRARPEGVANANIYMRQAARGEIPRRAPISTERIEERLFVVVDGNSTFINALRSGWSDIPCAIVERTTGKE